MSQQVRPIPEGFHTLTPYLHVRGGARAIEFYKQAFGAEERYRMPAPDGTIGHAEITIGDSIVMLADEMPSTGIHSPQSLQGTACSFLLYVEDVDAAFRRAVEAGATVSRPIEDKFYGDRTGSVVDPFGHEWALMTHIEDVSPEEMNRRAEAEFAKQAATAQT